MNWFRKVLQKIKSQKVETKNSKKRLAFSAIAVLMLLGVVFGRTIADNSNGSPRFNFMQNDPEMLRVAKTTDGNWGDPIDAKVGDQVAFLFYYHNGMVDTTAHSTKVRVDLPVNESKSLVAKSYLWSQETEAISDTIVDGKIVGQSGATINLPTLGRIEYVAGSTKWFANGSQTGVNMPDGIVSNSGLDLGDIQGCWQYSGYVTFLANIKGQTALKMDKKVAHPGENLWHDEIFANPGDDIIYKLGIRNDGDITAENVIVNDQLPSYMTYATGTTFYFTKDHPEGVKMADTLFSNGVSLPNVAPSDSGIIYITYKTKIAGNIPNGAWALNNVAKVYMNGVEQDQDQAKVTVTCDRGLVIDKKVSNGTSYVEENNVKIGDTISYRIIVRNSGNVPVDNVVVSDILPIYVSYNIGSTYVDGVKASDDIVANGINIGSLSAGAEKTIILSGKTFGCPPIGDYTLTNTAYVSGSGVQSISDIARSILTLSPVSEPTINVAF